VDALAEMRHGAAAREPEKAACDQPAFAELFPDAISRSAGPNT
jgi:hypothetical protein